MPTNLNLWYQKRLLYFGMKAFKSSWEAARVGYKPYFLPIGFLPKMGEEILTEYCFSEKGTKERENSEEEFPATLELGHQDSE